MSSIEQPVPKGNQNERQILWGLARNSRFLSGDFTTQEVLQSGKYRGNPIENLQDFLAAREAFLELEFAKKRLEEIRNRNTEAAKWAEEAGSHVEHAPRPEMEKH